jgi:hypothetical protein
MSMKDKFGNDLKTGSLVHITLSQQSVIGRVINIKEGGISLGGDGKMRTPSILTIASDFVIDPPMNQVVHTIKEVKNPTEN